MFIDSHAHSWDPQQLGYPWLASETRLNHLLEYDDAHAGLVVFVEGGAAPDNALKEALWASQQVRADGSARFARIVAGATLDSPSLPQHLASLRRLRGVVGVRHVLQELPATDLLRPECINGLRLVADAGLTFDYCIRDDQLVAVREVLHRVGPAVAVIDHLGGAPTSESITGSVGKAWRADMSAIADTTNALVKLSGVGLRSDGWAQQWSCAKDYVSAAYDAFGPGRCMIGSDWPVSTGPSRMPIDGWVALVVNSLGLNIDQADAVTQRTAWAAYFQT